MHHDEKGMVLNVKESIEAIILKGCELGVPRVFGLGVYALIFLNDLKLDLTSQTVVADACVVPLTTKNAPKIVGAINRKLKETIVISTSANEARAWKYLLPAFIERCRTWKHRGECEYIKRGIPACSMEDGWDKMISPLCRCGLGKDLGTLASVDDWRAVRSEATRIAISPLFPLLPLQNSMTEIKREVMKTMGKSFDSDNSCCAQCGGSGQGKLLHCGRCKRTQYCSRECQKAHWKDHKANCAAVEK